MEADANKILHLSLQFNRVELLDFVKELNEVLCDYGQPISNIKWLYELLKDELEGF